MTLVERWSDGWRRDIVRFRVNGCLDTQVADHEARWLPTHRDFAALATSRVAPLVWLAMPVHDQPQEGGR